MGGSPRPHQRRRRRRRRRVQTPPVSQHGPASSRRRCAAAAACAASLHRRQCRGPPLALLVGPAPPSAALRRPAPPTSSLLSLRTNLAGDPAQSSPSGTRRAGGSTLPGASMECGSIMDPSHSTLLAPTMQWSSTLQERSTHCGSTVTYLPTSVAAVRPVGEVLRRAGGEEGGDPGGLAARAPWRLRGDLKHDPRVADRAHQLPRPHLAAWMTVRSWMFDTEPIVMLFRSPRSTAPYQTLACGGRVQGEDALRRSPKSAGQVRGRGARIGPAAPLTLSSRSTSPTTTAFGATQASAAACGILLPRGMDLRWRRYHSSLMSRSSVGPDQELKPRAAAAPASSRRAPGRASSSAAALCAAARMVLCSAGCATGDAGALSARCGAECSGMSVLQRELETCGFPPVKLRLPRLPRPIKYSK
jgi:hypothetical protein